MSDLSKILKKSFKDKDYRHGYVDEFLNASIATQIKVLREQHGWSQKELARHAQMRQPRISVMENVNYSSWSIKILRELAEAFDLTLCVFFESFGKRLTDIEGFSRENLERFSFDDDPVFKDFEDRDLAALAMPILQAQNGPSYGNNVLPFGPLKSSGAAIAQNASRPQDEDAIPWKREPSGIGK